MATRVARAVPRRIRAGRARRALGWLRSPRARRLWRRLWAAPLAIRVVVGLIVLLAVWSAANWTYHVIRKPTELFFPVSGTLAKAPPETWRQYAPLFRRHSTATISPELLAALAQVEGSGDPGAALPKPPPRPAGGPAATACATTWSSRTAAGSGPSTCGCCRATRWR